MSNLDFTSSLQHVAVITTKSLRILQDRQRGHCERGLFTGETLQPLKSLNALESLEYGQILGFSKFFRISRKWIFLKPPLKRPLFRTQILSWFWFGQNESTANGNTASVNLARETIHKKSAHKSRQCSCSPLAPKFGALLNSTWNYNSHDTTTFECLTSTHRGPTVVTTVKWRPPPGHHWEVKIALTKTAKLQQFRANRSEMTTFAESCNARHMQRLWSDKLDTAQSMQNVHDMLRRFMAVVVSSAFRKSLKLPSTQNKKHTWKAIVCGIYFCLTRSLPSLHWPTVRFLWTTVTGCMFKSDRPVLVPCRSVLVIGLSMMLLIPNATTVGKSLAPSLAIDHFKLPMTWRLLLLTSQSPTHHLLALPSIDDCVALEGCKVARLLLAMGVWKLSQTQEPIPLKPEGPNMLRAMRPRLHPRHFPVLVLETKTTGCKERKRRWPRRHHGR